MGRGALLVVFATCATLAAANVNVIDDTIALFDASIRGDGRYSTDLLEDASLSVPDLIKKYGYPSEVHHVTTPDGYILEMHRIPHGRDNNNKPKKGRPVIFLMHGLLCSSSGYILMGPRDGLGYILAEEGYDVWMGNARGNTYSRRHVRLNPDAIFNTNFWTFSWEEIGSIDLPSMIDYALEVSGQDRLHYIGHSQGTTSFFVMGSMRPEYNQKIISMHALAPVAYMAHNNNLLFHYIAPFSKNIEAISTLVGVGEWMPQRQLYTLAGQALCRDEVVFQPLCSNMIFLIAGWNEEQHNATMMPIVMGHLPAGAAVRQFAHYAQGIVDNGFRRYDQGSRLANLRKYGSMTPPNFELGKITAPVFLHYSDSDPLAEVPDVDRLFRELGRPIGKFRVPLATFSHVDFLWAIDVRTLLYNRMINLIKAMDAHTVEEIDFTKF